MRVNLGLNHSITQPLNHLLFLALIAALASGCGPARRGGGQSAANSSSPTYPYSTDTSMYFGLGPSGLSPSSAAPSSAAPSSAAPRSTATLTTATLTTAQPAASAPSAPPVAALAPRVAAIAAKSGASGSSLAAIALNRYGYALLEASPDNASYRLSSFPLSEASYLSMADLWPRKNGFLLELYRDPFAAAAPARPAAAGQELFSIDEAGAASPLPRLGREGEELFALLPAGGRWYAELRAETNEGARLRYLRLDAPDLGQGKGAMCDIGRGDFERALEPRAIGGAPESLRSAAAALAPGALLVRARGGADAEGYWLSGGPLADAREASAWVSDDGKSALVVERAGEAAYVEAGVCRRLSISAPAKGAALTASAVLSLGTRRLALVAWESGRFPSIEASGLIVLPLADLR
jgi:hypothetical protein